MWKGSVKPAIIYDNAIHIEMRSVMIDSVVGETVRVAVELSVDVLHNHLL